MKNIDWSILEKNTKKKRQEAEQKRTYSNIEVILKHSLEENLNKNF